MALSETEKSWPASKVEMWPLDKIVPYDRNPRSHPEAQIALIESSMRNDGVTTPILVDEFGVIIAGHGRKQAAQRCGFTRYPVVVARGWSEERKRAVRIQDNQLAVLSEWDVPLLRAEISQLKLAQWDLSLLGFDAVALADLSGEKAAWKTDPDEVPEAPENPVSKLGDVWLLGMHRLLCGDSTKADDVSLILGSVIPNLMVSDPPYGVKYDALWRGNAGHATKGKNRKGVVFNDDRADWGETWALFPGSIAYIWHGGLTAAIVADSLVASGFKIRSQIIWNKTVMTIGRGDYHWKHEPCWYAVRGTGNWKGDRRQTTVWDIASPIHIMSGSTEEKTPHPTQKPVECMKRPIENNSKIGDAVYDPFLGSGTTIIAGEMTGRSVHAIELSPTYIDVAVLRWQNFCGKIAVLESTGKSFEETKAERQTKAAGVSPDRQRRENREGDRPHADPV